MMPPRRSRDLELVDLLLGVEAVRARVQHMLDSLIADYRAGDTPAGDLELVDVLLGLAKLARIVQLPPAAVIVDAVEPAASSSLEHPLR